MSILIKGATMPKNCLDCLSTLGLFSKTCPISDDSNIDVEFARHHIYDGCPLVEIPPHGRLIDADKLIENIPVTQNDGSMSCRNCDLLDDVAVEELIDNAPTVIESEEQENDG